MKCIKYTHVCTKGFDVFATLPNYSSCILKSQRVLTKTGDII